MSQTPLSGSHDAESSSLTCSVHERFCLAAARGDQVAEAANSKHPIALKHQASDTAPSQAVVTHTPAPDRPPHCTPHGSAETATSVAEAAVPSIMHGDSSAAAAALVTDRSLSSSGSHTGISAQSQASESPSFSDKAQSPAANRVRTEAYQSMAMSADASQHDIAQQQLPDCQDITQQSMTDPTTGNGEDAKTNGQGATGRTEGRSERPARIPLAAVQEAATPVLGSLSFKQTHMQAKRSDRMPSNLLHLVVVPSAILAQYSAIALMKLQQPFCKTLLSITGE